VNAAKHCNGVQFTERAFLFFRFLPHFTNTNSTVKQETNRRNLNNSYKSQRFCNRLKTNCHSRLRTTCINLLNAKLNPICHLLALLGAHHILHVSGLRVNNHLKTNQQTKDLMAETCTKRQSTSLGLYSNSCVQRVFAYANDFWSRLKNLRREHTKVRRNRS
jgi:hypothetical protein